MSHGDYISRQAAIDEACKGCNIEFPNEGCEPSDCDIKNRLMNTHAADVVEVVRCKDCKHDHKCNKNIIRDSIGGGYIYCPVDFCSYGERADK